MKQKTDRFLEILSISRKGSLTLEEHDELKEAIDYIIAREYCPICDGDKVAITIPQHMSDDYEVSILNIMLAEMHHLDLNKQKRIIIYLLSRIEEDIKDDIKNKGG